jgi:hypothetical protein
MRWLEILVTSWVVILAWPATLTASSFFAVFASNEGPRVAAVLRRHADFVAAPISLESDKSDAAERFSAIGAAKSALRAAVAKHEGWICYDGPLRLAAPAERKWTSGPSYDAGRVEATLLVPLRDDSDVFAEASGLMRFVSEFSKSAEVKARVGVVQLAVREPQQYRAQILKLIAEDATHTRDAMIPGGQFKLEGLEGPVLVRQLDERDVELFIDYRLAIEKR